MRQSVKGEDELFRASSRCTQPIHRRFVFLLSRQRLFMFSQRRVQRRLRPHLLWKWRRYTDEQEDERERGSGFLLERPIKPFCILLFSARKQSPIFFFSPGPRARKTFLHLFLSRFHLRPPLSVSVAIFLLPFTPRCFLLFLHLWTYPGRASTWSPLFAQASSKLLSEWLLRLACPSCPPRRSSSHALPNP